MTFTSIFAFIALSAAAVVALPAADNAPAQVYRRAACDQAGKDVMSYLSMTRNTLGVVREEYYRVARNPTLAGTFDRIYEDFGIVMFEIKDELGDPVRERSASKALNDGRVELVQTSQVLDTELERNGMAYPGSRLAHALDAYEDQVRRAEIMIVDLISCWKSAGGK
ncbi:hypothetical protein DFQ27_002667 [Actinomortierella ambigua]|uniref:Uncharacterized protein n=1 Tax=Actinomortierella ambigua TaxID=1343610 RepID=A0A9P6Q742_9FUNG|nr:hypothetical protein DFQ27_002667 [Actinomortierella ambigua]